MLITTELARLAAAAGVLAAYAALCVASWRTARRSVARDDQVAAPPVAVSDGSPVLVAHASQTGFAESLADEAADALRVAGVSVRRMPLGSITAEDLLGTEEALFIVSTSGEGDPPDGATAFATRVMASCPTLDGLHYGLLALGDSTYRNFCGFGQHLDTWLARCGARPMFDRIDLDRADPETLQHWRHCLGHVAGTADLPDWRAPDFQCWRLVARRLLNPGSAGLPTFHLELAYPSLPGESEPCWEAGDLLQIHVPGDADHTREYSIASLPGQGRVHLLVRQQRDEQGRPGRVSGWLTGTASVGDEVPARVRRHSNFRIGDNIGRPLILIGNGTGLAGLMAHLRQQADRGKRCWLVFGERHAAHDFYYREEIEDWHRRGLIQHLDAVFSRDGGVREYVQHRVAAHADRLRAWVRQGAAIYVCGNAVGMAPELDAVLAAILGRDRLDELMASGRYRRDVY